MKDKEKGTTKMENLHLVDNSNGTFNVDNWKGQEGWDYDTIGTFAFSSSQSAWVLWDECAEDNKGRLSFVGDGTTYFDSLLDSFNVVKDEYNFS